MFLFIVLNEWAYILVFYHQQQMTTNLVKQ